jgi:hypothetical protein
MINKKEDGTVIIERIVAFGLKEYSLSAFQIFEQIGIDIVPKLDG